MPTATSGSVTTLLPDLDRTGAPLAAQIAGFYADAIRDGRLREGTRLPPIREIATACRVTRATVQEAYRRLADRGLVSGVVGRGTTVLAANDAVRASDAPVRRHPWSPCADAALRRAQEMPGAPPLPPGSELVANFAELQPDDGRFPVAELRRAVDAALQTRGSELLGYGHASAGLPELRELLATRTGDANASADDILVTAGAQQALDLALRTFCVPLDTVVTSAPSYHQMHGLLRAHGLQAVSVPFGADGLDLAALRLALARGGVRLVYLMPTFHNPTGRTLDLAQRKALIDVLADTDVPVVEDEYQFALRFRGAPLPSLRTLDPRGLTLTVASASKELFPALRIGWVHGSPELLRPMAAVKRFMDLETSPLLQAALVEFVRAGCLDRYLGELRDELRARHGALQAACRRHLPAGCTITDPDGGFVAWLELPEPGQGDRLAERALERGVRVLPGRAFDHLGRPSRGVRLSLTRASTAQIAAGVRVLGECARDLLTTASAQRSFL